MNRWQLAWGVVLLLVVMSGCGAILDNIAERSALGALATGSARAAGSQLPIGEAEERAYGGAIAVMVVQKYGGVVKDEALLNYVNLVGNAVASVSDRPALRYHFGVLDSDQVNAMATPGGYVFITRGALSKMKSEAELAGVLAHEVGHITARHALKIIQNLKSASALTRAAGSQWQDAKAFSSIVDGFIADFLEKGLPKDTEYEADLIGTRLLVRLGYHGAGLRDFLKTMEAAHAAKTKTKFSATHPSTGERIRRLDAELARLGASQGPQNAERFAKRTGNKGKAPVAVAAPAP